jgi:hypothetical protein
VRRECSGFQDALGNNTALTWLDLKQNRIGAAGEYSPDRRLPALTFE